MGSRLQRWALAAALLLGGCAAPPAPLDARLAPERASALQASAAAARFQRQAVVAAHPLAAEAGAQALRDGGNALDAALSALLVLAVVEPQSSGIGGGGFLLLWDGQRLHSYDGRETAPAAVTERLFLRADGRPLPLNEAIASGLSVGVPGLLRMAELAHREQGQLPWARLFAPAIAAAEQGFEIGPRLHTLLDDAALRRQPAAAALYLQADGRPRAVGERLRNPALAAVLRQVATQGADAFYRGAVAADIVARVRAQARPGLLQPSDLATYQALHREPLCADWRALRLCGAPPPAAGLIVSAQILNLADRATVGEPLHRAAEAAKLAVAERERWVADPAFQPAPPGGWAALLAPEHWADQARRIGPRAEPAPEPAAEAGTTHLSVVDAQGRAVSLTASVESGFGSRILSDGGSGLPGGFFLNNQLTDFAFSPWTAGGQPHPNRVQPGKRPRSSMAPLIVFRDGRLHAVLGSPGGLAIPQYVARALLALEQGSAPQAAVAAPNWLAAGGRLLLEPGFDAQERAAAERRGHRVQTLALTSGLHLIVLPRDGSKPGLQTGVDPRREGAARGD